MADIIDPTLWQWKLGLLQHILTMQEIEAILKIPIVVEQRDDLLVWHPNKSGLYSVKFGYVVARSLQGKEPEVRASFSTTIDENMWKSLWNLNIPLKLRHFLWRVCHHLLATKVGLHKRKCGSSPICPICLSDAETVEHLLFDCPWT